MDFLLWVGLALVIGLLQAFAERKRKQRRGAKGPPPVPRAKPQARVPQGARVMRFQQPKQKGLVDLLAEFRRGLEEVSGQRRPSPAGGPLGRHVRAGLPSAEEVEERGSLEVEPETVSLEEGVRRPERVEVDQDEQVEEIVRRRLQAAEARDKPLSKVDHVAFDQRIRKPAPSVDPEAEARIRGARIRQAIVWREILGRPLGWG